MKVKQIIKLIETIEENRLPSDMQELGADLYEKSDGKYMSISDMDFIHLIRAFKKTLYEIDNDGNVAYFTSNTIFKLEKRVSELLEENQRLEKDSIDYVRRDVYEMLFDKCERLGERIKSLIPKKAIPKYDFCEVPNDSEGQEFIDNVKKYLNTKKYKICVRGQHVKEEYKGTGATAYGQSIEQSTHLRVYIEEK